MKNEKELIYCYPLPTDNVGISYTALSLYKEMRKKNIPVSFLTPMVRNIKPIDGLIQCVSWPIRTLPWRYLSNIALKLYEKKIMQKINSGTVVDLWSNNPTLLYEKLRQKKITICKEKFNCAQLVARKIISSEYEKLNIYNTLQINQLSIIKENREFQISDFIMSPSPMVKESILLTGVDSRKIIDTSFGWEPCKKPVSKKSVLKYKSPRFLFVGAVCIRKGAHLLIDYWKKANIEGTLIFLGQIQKEMEIFVKKVADRNDIVFLGHYEKAFNIYSECDVFCFPSLEEGGPLVTYEALSRGLPSIVSPMGAGAPLRNGIEGFIIDPHDELGWIDAMKIMTSNITLREKFAKAGITRSLTFTWEKVAEKRYTEIMNRIAK